MSAFFRGVYLVTVGPSAELRLSPSPVVHHEHILQHRADELDKLFVGWMDEIDVAIFLRIECDQVTVLKTLVESLWTVVHPFLEPLDFVDFLFQRGKRLLHLGDLLLQRFCLVLETDKVSELLRLIFIRRLSGHTRKQHPQAHGQAQQS